MDWCFLILQASQMEDLCSRALWAICRLKTVLLDYPHLPPMLAQNRCRYGVNVFNIAMHDLLALLGHGASAQLPAICGTLYSPLLQPPSV